MTEYVTEEPPVGQWVIDSWGAISKRMAHGGWGLPGFMALGEWNAMLVARGPMEICAEWGSDRCKHPNPTHSGLCTQLAGHDGSHSNPHATWAGVAPLEAWGIPGLTDEEVRRFHEALQSGEVLGTIAFGDDQDTLVLTLGGEQVSTLSRALKSTKDEVGAWIAGAFIVSQGKVAGLDDSEVAETLRAAARHLSSQADRMEGDWG